MNGAFGTAALDLHGRGLAVLPTGGADGKRPLVKGWDKWRGQSESTVVRFATKHSTANIAILTGRLSMVTVVDCDDEQTLADAEHRFGRTPVVTRSPRGGGHLWFQHRGERNANLRKDGLNIDIRGEGGIVLAPPSTRPGVGLYRFERGSWDELGKVPGITPGALPASATPSPPSITVPAAVAAPARCGGRHDALFRALLPEATTCPTLGELVARAHGINATFNPPIGADDHREGGDVERTARSVWRMKSEGRLMLPGQQKILMLPEEHRVLGADAFYLLALIKRQHGARISTGDLFRLSPKAMERAEVLAGWGRRRYTAAIRELCTAGVIHVAHKGGRCKGDTSAFGMGARKGPYVTRHPPPCLPLPY